MSRVIQIKKIKKEPRKTFTSVGDVMSGIDWVDHTIESLRATEGLIDDMKKIVVEKPEYSDTLNRCTDFLEKYETQTRGDLVCSVKLAEKTKSRKIKLTALSKLATSAGELYEGIEILSQVLTELNSFKELNK